MTLNKRQTKFLRTLAHDQKPIIWVGQQGLMGSVMDEVENALNHHELVKIKLRVEDREERDQIIESICQQTKAVNIQQIGNTVTLFRRNLENPRIPLPA